MTLAMDSSVGAHTLGERFERAERLEQFIARARHYPDLWRDMHARARVPDMLVSRARRLPATRRLLVLLEDWCGDAINTIPPLAALVDDVPQLELRVLERDRNPDLMDAHLTGVSRSIPVVIVLDEAGTELGWWGPRPIALQQWAMSPEARAMDPADRYREMRRWYARDKGHTTIEEILRLIEGATP